MNWDDFEVFCRVTEHGGFSAAARALGRPKSSVSASVMRLETMLNARLLERTTRHVRLTEAGEALYQSVGPLLGRLREVAVEAMAQGGAVGGTLRIAAPYEFGAHYLGTIACQMMGRHPGLKIHIDVEHAAVSPFDRPYDIVFSMVDGELPVSNVVARRVFSLERGLFAAPALVARQREPAHPEDLAGLPLLAAAADAEWSFTGPDGVIVHVPVVAPRMRSSNAGVRLQAALAGLGVARITATYCEEAVRTGQLRPLLADWICAPLRIYALLPGRRLMPAKVRAFLDALGTLERQ